MSKIKNKTAIEFIETLSTDEQDYIYDMYNDMAVSDLIDLLFEYMPSDDIEAEIQDYRRETAGEEENDRKAGYE